MSDALYNCVYSLLRIQSRLPECSLNRLYRPKQLQTPTHIVLYHTKVYNMSHHTVMSSEVGVVQTTVVKSMAEIEGVTVVVVVDMIEAPQDLVGLDKAGGSKSPLIILCTCWKNS